MHSLLEKQLLEHFGSLESLPEDLGSFLELVSATYAQADRARRLSDRTAELSQEKLIEQIQRAEDLQKSQEDRLQRVTQANAISSQIASATNLEELYKIIASSIQERLGFDTVHMFRYSQNTSTLSIIASAGHGVNHQLTSSFVVHRGNGTVGKAAEQLVSQIILDTQKEPSWSPVPGGENARSEIAIPIKLGKNLIGVIFAQSNRENGIHADTQLILEVLTGQISFAIESIRLRSEMEDRINELGQLQRITTGEGWKSFQDTTAHKTAGYTYNPATGEPRSMVTDNLETNSFSQEMSIRGEVIGAIGIEDDPDRPLSAEELELLDSITEEVAEALERARLFETSQRSAAELTILNEMGNSFTESLNELAIVENIYIYAAKLLQIDEFYIALYQAEDDEVSFPLSIYRGERVTANHPHWQYWQPRPANVGLTGYIINTRQPILIEANAEEVLTDLEIPFERHGELTQTWMGVPLAIGERVLGVIAAQSERYPALYSEHHLGLLNAVASQAAIAIDNARLFHQEQSRATQERLVRTITDQVRRGTSTQDIMRIALEEISRAINADRSVIRLGTKDQLLHTNPAITPPLQSGSSLPDPESPTQDN